MQTAVLEEIAKRLAVMQIVNVEGGRDSPKTTSPPLVRECSSVDSGCVSLDGKKSPGLDENYNTWSAANSASCSDQHQFWAGMNTGGHPGSVKCNPFQYYPGRRYETIFPPVGTVAAGKLNSWMTNAFAAQKNSYSVSHPNDQKEDRDEWLQLLQAGKEISTPNVGYICHICYNRGHFIYDCPRKHEMESDTPYQGPNQCYGEFQCPKCKRRWSSRNSWAQHSQNCLKCNIAVFPRKQLPLNKAIEKGLVKPKHIDRNHSRFMNVPKSGAAPNTGHRLFNSSGSPFKNMGTWN